MKRKFKILIAAMMLLAMINLTGKTWADETTYTFTSASWEATSGGNTANWTSGAAGNGFTSGQGIQVTTTTTGANGTSPVSFPKVSKIVVTYNTNKSQGAGSIGVQIGTNSETTNNVAYSGSGDGRTANYTTTFNYATVQTGNVKITVNTTTNSIWLKSVEITYTSDPTITIGSPTGGAISVKKTSDMSNISTGTIASGTGITLNATPNTGYEFTTWNVIKTGDPSTQVSLTNAATVASNSFSMPSYNTTVNATFTKQSYNVTLGSPADADLSATDMNEISISAGETKAVPYGTELVLEADMEDGKMFVWRVTKTSGGDDVTAAVLSGITATDALLTVPDYAVTVSGTVQDLKYIVTYKANGGVGSDVVEYYSPGANVTVADNAFTYSGHVFKKWNTQDDGEGTNYAEGATISSIAADVTLYAQWADAWTVTLSTNGSTTTTEVEQTQSITLSSPASVPSGFVYKGWTATPETPFNMVSTTYTPTANVTLYAVFAKTVQEYTEKTTLLHGSILKTGDDITSSITKTSDGISYTLSPETKIKRMIVSGSDAFSGVDSTILIGKNGAYIKNNTPFGEGITKFEIYQNGGASTKVTVGVYFKTTTIDSYVAYNATTNINSWEGTLSTLDEVYDASSALYNASTELIGAKYFWYQVTNPNNSQIAFRITYIAPVYYTRIYPSETINAESDITITSPTIIPSGAILNMGSHQLTNSDANNLVIEDGGQLILAKTNTGVAATVKKNVSAATAGSKTDATYWYAISAGVANPSILDNTNLITETSTPYHYDLYRFNEEENAGNAWENYRAHSTGVGADFTTLEKGRGYLYRNASALTITMTGDINVEDFEYDVTKTGTGEYAGFNLIGNPYTHDIYKGAGTAITNGTSTLSTGFYYLEPSTGKWAKGTDNSTAIAPNQGILVQVDATGNINMTNTDDDGVAKSNNDYIMLSVANSQYSDEAYAWFDKGIGLNKIEHRNSEIPMLYINQNDENFAIATMSDETQSFNLNFKAATMGKYTLSYKAKGEYNYLHVIDRLTGEDVDMLLEGEYSFIGAPTDNDNRFIVKLCYNANSNATDNDIFAYQSGSDIIVNGEGELQVFDVTGRKVATQHVNGVETINLQSQGVYIFKLNEKVQKIVVR